MICFILIFALTLWMSASIKTNSDRELANNSGYVPKEVSFAFITTVLVLIIYAGFRKYYNDTTAYMRNYESYYDFDLSAIDYNLNQYPGFVIFSSFLKSIGISAQNYVLILSAIAITSQLRYLKKYSLDMQVAVLLFMAGGSFVFSMAAMKQITAMAIAIWAVPRMAEKKYISAAILMILAVTIHPYVAVIAVAFFMQKKVSSKEIYAIGLVMAFVLFRFSDVMTSDAIEGIMGEGFYAEEILNAPVLNMTRFILYSVPAIACFVYRKRIDSMNNKMLTISCNLTIVYFLTNMPGLAGGANSINRMASYFLPFTCIAMAAIFPKGIDDKGRKPLRIAMFVGYIALFIYAYKDWGLQFKSIIDFLNF